MRKNALIAGIIPIVCVLLFTVLAYQHSLTVSRMYDQRMHEDIQSCAQQLAQTGLSSTQVEAVRTVLNEVNHHTLSFVSSEADFAIEAAGFIGIIMASSLLALALKPAGGNSPR